MIEQVCPVCTCIILGDGYEKEGVEYCCEPCSTGVSSYGCECCHPIVEDKEIH